MALLDVDVSSAVEPTIIPAGTEVKLRISGCKFGEDKNGNAYIMPFFEAPEEETSKEFNHYMPLPREDMSAKDKNKASWEISQLCQAFDLAMPLDTDDMTGAEGWAIVDVRPAKDGYDESNSIKKFVAGN